MENIDNASEHAVGDRPHSKGPFKSMSELIEHLTSMGFADSFILEGDKARSSSTKKMFAASELRIVDSFRYEGESDPDDMAVVYAVEANDSTRGLIIDAFGTYADPALGEFISKITVDEKEKGVV